MLEARNISKSFASTDRRERIHVLNDVSLKVSPSSITSIVGASGSGKSTLLHILGGLDRPDKGKVYYRDDSLFDMSDEHLARFRNENIGFIFQFHHLLPEFSALENVFMPALIRNQDMNEITNRAEQMLKRLDLDDRMDHRPSQLSGGEQQRVAVARALMNNPGYILADEPTGNLDEKNTRSLLDLLFEIRDEEKVALVLVTHDSNIASKADVTFELSEGRLVPED